MPDAVEAVERLFAAINSGRLDDALEMMSPEVSWARPPDVPVTGTIHGREKVAKMWRAFGDPLTWFEMEPTRIREAPDGVLAHVTFKGSVDGADGERSTFEFAGAQTFRVGADGMIAEVREFKTIPEAEEDVAV